ncbi:MAG: VOC family protein [Kiloniellales bacterium]
MIDHVSIAVRDLNAGVAFYTAVLEPLGLALMVRRAQSVGFGKRYPEFWLNLRPKMSAVDHDTGQHVCLRAPSKEAVEAFFGRALDLGGRSAGDPGDRQAAMSRYFGAFIRDPDGNKIETVIFYTDD